MHEFLNDLTPLKYILNHSPQWKFIELNSLPSLSTRINLPYLILLKINDVIDIDRLTISSKETKLPLCKIHYLYSVGIIFGYIIELPKFQIAIHPTYVVLLRPMATKVKLFTDVGIIFQDKNITALYSEDGALLISMHNKFSFLNPNILRAGSNNVK